MDDPGLTTVVGRLALAVVLAATLGWDRERRHKSAGLRTHMMVALGAAGFTLLGVELLAELGHGDDALHIDISRIIQGVIGGVGFLGAGAIIQARGGVHGMTTAAGIWVTAAIGVSCALGEYAVALSITALGFLVLSAALWGERMLAPDEPEEANSPPP